MISYQASSMLRVPANKAVGRPQVIRVGTGFDERCVQILLDRGQPVLPIIIDSYGGFAHGLLAMMDIIDSARDHAKIATIVEGKAMSAGLHLFACGDKGLRFVGPNASVMLHHSMAGAHGKLPDIEVTLEEAKRVNDRVLALLDKHAGRQPGYFAGLLRDAGNTDLHWTPEQCVAHGVADKVGLPQIVISIGVDFRMGVVEETSAPSPKRKAAKS